eukprot:CAMPEP_0195627558 /NCGR_PEP_ID=MMETSP0815-20121206/18990_1 /TAXON_ID=97485 /ORGANISM="Prymnesium parvum, Strain Texoma1" /LENGTH=424 /DNA_ID=CAMNT_0040768789 /DNA_START=194 /DNA_END=1466 /DNA_ORIENTATION=-
MQGGRWSASPLRHGGGDEVHVELVLVGVDEVAQPQPHEVALARRLEAGAHVERLAGGGARGVERLLDLLVLLQLLPHRRAELGEAVVVQRDRPVLPEEAGQVVDDALVEARGQVVHGGLGQADEADPVLLLHRLLAEVQDRVDHPLLVDAHGAELVGAPRPLRRLRDQLAAEGGVRDDRAVVVVRRVGRDDVEEVQPAGQQRRLHARPLHLRRRGGRLGGGGERVERREERLRQPRARLAAGAQLHPRLAAVAAGELGDDARGVDRRVVGAEGVVDDEPAVVHERVGVDRLEGGALDRLLAAAEQRGARQRRDARRGAAGARLLEDHRVQHAELVAVEPDEPQPLLHLHAEGVEGAADSGGDARVEEAVVRLSRGEDERDASAGTPRESTPCTVQFERRAVHEHGVRLVDVRVRREVGGGGGLG